MSTDLIEYGSKLDAHSISETLAFLFDANLKNELETGERPTPICIWGTHGLGKTQSVVSYARDRGWKMAYCAPAQFEEMGDLHGAAREFAENKGYGPLAVDNNGWTLLHHAAVQSQHGRGMIEVFRGLLEAVPVEVMDQTTGGGTPTG